MTDSRDSLSLSLDDILAAARSLSQPEQSREQQKGAESTTIDEAVSAVPADALVERTEQAEPPFVPDRSGFNFVFDPEAVLHSDLIKNATMPKVPQQVDQTSRESRVAQRAATARSRQAPSAAMTGVVSTAPAATSAHQSSPARSQEPSHPAAATQAQEPAVGSPLIDASIDVIASLPLVPHAAEQEVAAASVAVPSQEGSERPHTPSLTRREQRAAQRAAEIAAGQREPNERYREALEEGRHAKRTAVARDSTTQVASKQPDTDACATRAAHQRKPGTELASQSEMRSWEQAGVQRAALEFLENSRREYAKANANANASESAATADQQESSCTSPIKLNPVEATSAVSEARRAESEQKVFTNEHVDIERSPQKLSEFPTVSEVTVNPTPIPRYEVFEDAQAEAERDANMSWVDAGRPEWTDMPTVKPRHKKKRHDPEDERYRGTLIKRASVSESTLDSGVASSIEDRMRQARKKQRTRIRNRVTAVIVVCLLGIGVGAAVGLGYYPVTMESGQVIFGDKKLVLGERQAPSSSDVPSNTAKPATDGNTAPGATKEPEQQKDLTGEVVYGYTLNDANGESYAVVETVEFGSDGMCGHSTMEASFSNEQTAADYFATVQRDYGKSFVGGSSEGNKTTVTIDVASSKFDRERYEDTLRNTVSDLMIIKKS